MFCGGQRLYTFEIPQPMISNHIPVVTYPGNDAARAV